MTHRAATQGLLPSVLACASFLFASGCGPGGALARTSEAASDPSLTTTGGRVIGHPKIHNLYMDSSWDSDNPAALSKAAIDAFTQQLVDSNYFAKAGQYGVGSASFTGSDDAGGVAAVSCPVPIAFGKTDFLAINAWVTCMTVPGAPFVRPTVTGIPAPDDDTLYAVYVPSNTQIWDLGISSCGDFGAYHFWSTTQVWQNVCSGWECLGCFCPFIPEGPWCCAFCGPICGPVLQSQTFAYAVVPAECANASIDGLSSLASHEIIEAATDPIIPTGWIDWSTLGFNQDLVKKGEAADICESGVGDAGTEPVRLTNGLLVAPYWSNADGACVPITHAFLLDETGLPGAVPHQADFDGAAVSLPFSARVDDGSTHSYSFPSPVNDPDPGIRWVTAEPPETLVVTGDVHRTAHYTAQYLLTVQAAPAEAAALDGSLTPGGWMDAGAAVTLTTDPLIVLGPDSRFRFDRWSGDVSGASPTLPLVMSGPTSATANYALQYLVTVSTSGLGASPTHVFDGSVLLGTASDASPLAAFADAGPMALNVDASVGGPGGAWFFFQGFTPAPPATLSAPFATTAGYASMDQLIAGGLASGGIYGPGAHGLANASLQQWAAVQADLASGNWAQALQDLESFISHLRAQAGKHVTPDLARALELDALLVYHQALCQAVAAGQIDAAGAAAAYAYYAALVAELGGTALPACS